MSTPTSSELHTRRAAGRRWPWVVGSSILTSAVWVAITTVVILSGSKTDGPHRDVDLRGYHVVDDLCSATDVSPLTNAGFTIPAASNGIRNPQWRTVKHASKDSMVCSTVLEPSGKQPAGYSSANLDTNVTLSKQSDPAPEFAAIYQSKASGDFGPRYPQPVTTKIEGLGDDAFQTVWPNQSQTKSIHVAVWARVGWMVLAINLSVRASGDDLATNIPSESDAITMLRKSAEASLVKLRS